MVRAVPLALDAFVRVPEQGVGGRGRILLGCSYGAFEHGQAHGVARHVLSRLSASFGASYIEIEFDRMAFGSNAIRVRTRSPVMSCTPVVSY